MSTGFLIESLPDVIIVSVNDKSGPTPIVTPDITPILLEGGDTKIVTSPEGPPGPQGLPGVPGPAGQDASITDIDTISLNGGNF